MVMYPHPHHVPIPNTPQSASPSVSHGAQGSKRKRKSATDGRDKGSDDETGPSGSDAGRAVAAAAEMKKRTKTVGAAFYSQIKHRSDHGLLLAKGLRLMS